MLVRIFLIGLVIYLLVRSFTRAFEEQEPENKDLRDDYTSDLKNKGVSKEVGEYVDYEEVKDE